MDRLARRAQLAPTQPSRHVLTLEEPAGRGLTSLNLRREDKEVFDRLQGLWSYRKGRSLRQWDAFTYLLALALDHPECEAPRRE